jgi:hypothetical protein
MIKQIIAVDFFAIAILHCKIKKKAWKIHGLLQKKAVGSIWSAHGYL